jgi:CheY-like chemotaxis protein
MNSATNKVILIVEDTPEFRESVGDFLEDEGFDTSLAADGREALAQLHDGLKPDLILLDLMMPGMGGLEFREEQLRDPALADIPVVLMTAVSTLDAKELHLSHLLVKPFSPPELLAAIESAKK